MIDACTHLILGEDKYVPGGQVAVDETLTLEVGHTLGHLCREVAQHAHGEGPAHGRLLQTLEEGAQRGQLRHLKRVLEKYHQLPDVAKGVNFHKRGVFFCHEVFSM